MTGTHLNDATIFGPIYWRDRLVGFSATRAHWLDVGAKDAGGPMDSREIYQEGMRWAPTRIYDRGEPREDIIDLLRRNGRFGYSLVGDMNAQVAGVPHRGGALPGDPRPLRHRDLPRGARRDLPPVRAARARGGRRPAGRDVRGGRLPRQRRPRPRADQGAAPDRHRGRRDEARPRGLLAPDGRARQLRLRPDRLGLPRRLQAADQPGASRGRGNLPHARREGAARVRSSTPRSRRHASGTSARSGF